MTIVSDSYYLIKNQLNKLQEETICPDEFIYEFIGIIQKEWHSESCHSKVRKLKRRNYNQDIKE